MPLTGKLWFGVLVIGQVSGQEPFPDLPMGGDCRDRRVIVTSANGDIRTAVGWLRAYVTVGHVALF
jgi:hypothetical protein